MARLRLALAHLPARPYHMVVVWLADHVLSRPGRSRRFALMWYPGRGGHLVMVPRGFSRNVFELTPPDAELLIRGAKAVGDRVFGGSVVVMNAGSFQDTPFTHLHAFASTGSQSATHAEAFTHALSAWRAHVNHDGFRVRVTGDEQGWRVSGHCGACNR